jgi:hypothetical protein
MQTSGLPPDQHAPNPIVRVAFDLEVPPVTLFGLEGAECEYEGNRFLRAWSLALRPTEVLEVRVDAEFANGDQDSMLHLLRSYGPDSTIRDGIYQHRLSSRTLTPALAPNAQAWRRDLAMELYGWPSHRTMNCALRKWATNRSRADLHDSQALGRAEYCSNLVARLALDYPIHDAPRAALQDTEGWDPQDLDWGHGVASAYRRANHLLLRFYRTEVTP